MSLRKAINKKCKDCIYDNLAAGNWRQQVTICSDNSCPLWNDRPKSSTAIPNKILSYYGVKLVTSQGSEVQISKEAKVGKRDYE